MKHPITLPAILFTLCLPLLAAGMEAAATDTRALDEQIQSIKTDAVQLNRDLAILEEELLFPANTQVAVFLSMDVGEFFALDSVELRVDDKQVSRHLYTPREAEALLKGGVQRLYLGNLKVGEHELVALFTGKGPNGQDYSRCHADFAACSGILCEILGVCHRIHANPLWIDCVTRGTVILPRTAWREPASG
jgi:hypothetical protein